MATTAREWLQYVPESAYGVVPTISGSLPTGSGYIRLDQSNAFQVRPNIASTMVAYGGGIAIPAQRIPGTVSVTGTLSMIMNYTQAPYLLGWALTNVTGASGTPPNVPWATSIAPGDLASMSLYHTERTYDNALVQRCYRGCKVTNLTIALSDDNPLCRSTFTIMAQEPLPSTDIDPINGHALPTGEFIDPTYTSYPTDFLHFWNTRGNVKIGTGTTPPARTMYRSLDLTFTNQIATRYYEFQWPSIVQSTGRNSTFQIRSLHRVAPTSDPTLNDRSNYEKNSDLTAQVVFSNGTNSVTINYHGKNRINTPPADDLAIDGPYEQTVSAINMFDFTVAAGTQPDLVVTFS